MDADAFFRERTLALVKERRETLRLSYKELSERLSAMGYDINHRQLTNRVNRGTFTWTFALALFTALEVRRIDIPQLPVRKTAPR